MNIAILANTYGSLSETFVRRETEALQRLGHTITVLTGGDFSGPAGAPPTVPVERWADDAVRRHAPEVLYAEMGLLAHKRAYEIAQAFNIPFALRVWSGHDAFVQPPQRFYGEASRHRLCLGVIVEDEHMRGHAIERMGVDPARLHIVPNSVDVERFAPAPKQRDGPVRVLAIARFVEKKGLIHLVRAFNRVRTEGANAQLALFGYGPELERLQVVAGRDVLFFDAIPEANLTNVYDAADIFAAPCIKTSSGDADGTPTTVLESLSCGLAVIASDLLSAREYVQPYKTGVLVPPGDENALTTALAYLIENPGVRAELGQNARAFAVEHLDIHKNIARIEAVLAAGSRENRWRRGLDAIAAARATRSPERNERYERINAEALAFLQPYGDVLDVGCGDGSMMQTLRRHYALQVDGYMGVDPQPPPWEPMPGTSYNESFHQGSAEELPIGKITFDTVLCYSVLQHVENPTQALSEMHRVLKPGGRLALLVCVDDPNPIFLSWWKSADVLALVEQAGFRVEASTVLDQRHLCVRGVK